MDTKHIDSLPWPKNHNLVLTMWCYGCIRERLAAPTEEVRPTCCGKAMGADAVSSTDGWWIPYDGTHKPKTQENRNAKNARQGKP